MDKCSAFSASAQMNILPSSHPRSPFGYAILGASRSRALTDGQPRSSANARSQERLRCAKSHGGPQSTTITQSQWLATKVMDATVVSLHVIPSRLNFVARSVARAKNKQDHLKNTNYINRL